ncbi:MAG: hypothetical protein GXP43_03375 [bacterium]|nr:hypothetical protein [bacterium]
MAYFLSLNQTVSEKTFLFYPLPMVIAYASLLLFSIILIAGHFDLAKIYSPETFQLSYVVGALIFAGLIRYKESQDFPLASLLGFGFMAFALITAVFLYAVWPVRFSPVDASVILVFQFQIASIMQRLVQQRRIGYAEFLTSFIAGLASVYNPQMLIYFPLVSIVFNKSFDLVDKHSPRFNMLITKFLGRFGFYIVLAWVAYYIS